MGRIFKAYQLTSGVQSNQWQVFNISCPRVYNSNSHYCSCSWNYHINIVGRHKFAFRLYNSTVQHPNSRMIRWKATTQWNPLVKLDATGQILCPQVFGICLGNEALLMTKSIIKGYFMPETFMVIDNNLQRWVTLHWVTTKRFETFIFIRQM